MLAQALDLVRRTKDTAAPVGHLANVLRMAVDAAHKGCNLRPKGSVTIGTTKFPQTVKFTIFHAAAGTARFFFCLAGIIGISHFAEKVIVDNIKIGTIREISLLAGTFGAQMQLCPMALILPFY